ncbi:phosphate signaling complex protein PhoU [Pisciglobus halotolerans]|uniref:Phosphate-specific transport system accessory protein PhoU n=1 Tax=Pisciglobus halotolerans TaxID=745365 RepID=A0A1I3BJZ8_9LACT|nr:phosphate signaling complex protein PhoU [Pisciglobus halotolerans]SFH62598.1 phosphate uptake regulator, PhoU [Pisciglobus halotolerans]
MRQAFEEEVNTLHIRFLEMGKLVNEAVYKSVKAFTNHDKQLALQVIEEDHLINQREQKLEESCFELIALQQPVTSDLRKIITVMKASADLERMGDHAVSISKSTIRVKGRKRDAEIEARLVDLAELVKVSLEEVLTAYLKSDVKKAKAIAAKDKKINERSKEILSLCIEDMKKDTELVFGATDYMLVSTYLERIGDYVTNICEWIVYLSTGKMLELNTKNVE